MKMSLHSELLTYLILDVVGLCRLTPFNCPTRYSGPVCSWMHWWRWR